MHGYPELEQLERDGEYDQVMEAVRDLVSADLGVLADPYIKAWCGRRWRNLFLQFAESDTTAIKAASKDPVRGLLDSRSDRQKLAERFLKGDARDEWRVEMPPGLPQPMEHTTLVFAPGLINGLLPVRAFQTAFPAIEERYGWRILRADAHPVRGCEANIADYLAAVNSGLGLRADRTEVDPTEAQPPEDVFFIGYSKGSPDVLTLLAHHPELAARTRAVFTWAGAVGGSYLADGFYEGVKDVELGTVGGALTGTARTLLKLLAPVIDLEAGSLRRLDEYDIKTAIRDLTTWHRREFLDEHAATLNELGVPFFNITGATAALEVPTFQVQGYLQNAQYDANNDMQVTQAQSTLDIPMSTHLAMVHAHHWDMSYDRFPMAIRAMSPNLDHPFPKEAAITAIVVFGQELGLLD